MRRSLPLALLIAAGCGEPLRTADYPGEPLAAFTAVADQPTNGAFAPLSGTRAALLWSIDDETFVQQPDASPRLVDGAGIRLVLHTPPPLEARAEGFAVGRVVFYVDLDDDGRLDPDESVISPIRDLAFFWSPAGIEPGEAPVTLPMPAGYVRVDGYLPCAGPFERSGETACTAPLGERCADDVDCGDAGRCVRDRQDLEASGYCVTAARVDDPCPPANARRVPTWDPPVGMAWVWARACATDADCPTPLSCAAGSGTCAVRDVLPRVRVSPGEWSPQVCVDDEATFYRIRPDGAGPAGAPPSGEPSDPPGGA